MSSWGQRQQIKYISIIVGLAILLAAYPIYKIFIYHQASCFDGKQNQDETGTDCGGVCLAVCQADSLNPVVLYTRILEVTPSVYSAIAQIENPNVSLLAESVPYTFKVYDENNVEIAESSGSTFIWPNDTFPIFEGGIKTSNTRPARISFQFDQLPVWRKATSTVPVLDINNINLSLSTSTQRLDANMTNPTPYNFKAITAVALLYDANDNLVAASQTIVDSLPKNQSAHLIFTWPEPFDQSVAKIDIVPEIPPSDFIPHS